MKIDFRKAFDAGHRPRVHGNGFIQLDLGEQKRLHIWGHPAIPRQIVDTGIHDHRFDFTSTVIAGRLINARYHPGNATRYKIYTPQTREGEDTILCETGASMMVANPTMIMVREGEKYGMFARDFHESFTDRPSATVMTKLGSTHPEAPRVLVPLGKEPDNDFNRNVFENDFLWGIIKEVIGYGL